MKMFTENKCVGCTGSFVKSMLVSAASIAVVYSFLYMPIANKMARQACNVQATEQAQAASVQVAEYNQNLEGEDQPISIDEVALYGAQYTICLHSQGL